MYNMKPALTYLLAPLDKANRIAGRQEPTSQLCLKKNNDSLNVLTMACLFSSYPYYRITQTLLDVVLQLISSRKRLE
jgi:hypothetical protein